MKLGKQTHPINDAVFKAVYDTPTSLPGRHEWLTRDEDVRKIEKLLGIPHEMIGAPLGSVVTANVAQNAGGETNWLDIVSSALGPVHAGEVIARVILGTQKYVNTEAPRAIAGLKCFQCKAVIDNLRSFKCHNWA
jgi:hypothetical protein